MIHFLTTSSRPLSLFILAVIAWYSHVACKLPSPDRCESSGRVCPRGSQCAEAQDICIPNNCGNGVVDKGEVCDDGNVMPGDGCPPDCGWCGNDEVDEFEVCDGKPPPGDNCVVRGFDMGALQCAAGCDAVQTEQCIVFSWQSLRAGESWQIGRMWGNSPDNIYAGGYLGEAGQADAPFSQRGTIFHYDGQEWSANELGGPALADIWGAGPDDVFAVGFHGVIWHYNGDTWSPMNSGTSEHLFGVWGTNSTNVYAVGKRISLHYDGSHWRKMQADIDEQATFYDIWGSGPDNVFATTDDGQILHYTNDGTEQWNIIKLEWDIDVTGIWVNSTDDIYAIGIEGTVVHYNGVQWSLMNSNVTQTLLSVWSGGAGQAFAVGIGGTIIHYNGNPEGVWEQVNSGVESDLIGLWGVGEEKVVVGGFDETILEYTGSGWFTPYLDISLDIRAVWGTGPRDLFAVGDGGMILRHDGSRDSAWRAMNTGTSLQLFGVWGNGTGLVFAIGKAGTILVYDGNEELTWTALPGVVSQDLHGIWSDRDGMLYVVGDEGTILRYDPSGTWMKMKSNSSATLRSIWGTDSKNVYAVGESGTILHFDGNVAGQWTSLGDGGNLKLYDIWGSRAGDVFAVGDGGLVLHYDGNEEGKWQIMDSGVGLELRTIWGYGPSDVFAAGSSGTLIHYDGDGWSPVRFGSSTTILDIWAPEGGKETIFGGRDGMIRSLRRAVPRSSLSPIASQPRMP